MERARVIVVGGGHAGVEAAWAAANLLGGVASVLLLTHDPETVGVMSCNPAIGGLAKGQLVREIDALNGVMGLAADASGIQFKVLNQSKGPAAQGPRAQCDKHEYARSVRRLLAGRPEIEVVGASVEGLRVSDGAIRGCEVILRSGERKTLHADAVVLTTGTFLRGLMHTGETKTRGGRVGEAAAFAMSDALRDLGFELGRLKTGTPPRLRRGSIDWERLEAQHGDVVPQAFSELSGSVDVSESLVGAASAARFPVMRQVECRLTSTTREAHDLIRANLHRAPMFSGQIEGAGPRYCPSIEDKVVRFADRDAHGVFLEPESLESDWVYCNGISTSLPADVQERLVRSMAGCERAEILRLGYAVEYDVVRPHQILATCETRLVRGLYLAGQLNGTSGYEEAAAQGLVAGINAARRVLCAGEVIFGRDEAYIGVLMDDLVTKTPVEPYRMFTSRAEHRLLLRSDNAPERLTLRAREIGLLSGACGAARERAFECRRARVGGVEARVRAAGLERRLRGQAFEPADLAKALGDIEDGPLRHVHAEHRYEAYIVRQRAEVKRQAAMEARALPSDADYSTLPHLRPEARQALAKYRPRTFGQASRLEGITPADITLLSVVMGAR